MRKLLYPRLAAVSLRKNAQSYLPYLFASVGTVMMFYIMLTLRRDPVLGSMSGGADVRFTLTFGSIVVAIFSVIVLLYTNSFLMKQRKKEFGLYNILGMEKKHIGKVIFWETIYTFATASIVGILSGIVFSKLIQLLLMRLLRLDVKFGMAVDPTVIGTTSAIFLVIFFIIYIRNLLTVHLAQPIKLLYGTNEGEREPKSKWLLALLGVLSLGGGYYLSLSTNNAYNAIINFFIAVLLVIAGTYLLFTSVSIVFLKGLRKNKKYYYQTRHFATVSGMLYRMKRNAAGLASICILSSMVLVTVSTTICLYLGVDGIMAAQYPSDISITYYTIPTQAQQAEIEHILYATADEMNRTISDMKAYKKLAFTVLRIDGKIIIDAERMKDAGLSDGMLVWVMTLNDYNKLSGSRTLLSDGEALCFCDGEAIGESLELMGIDLRLTTLDSFPVESGYRRMDIDTCYLVVKDEDVLTALEHAQNDVYGDNASLIQYHYYYNIDGNREEKAAYAGTVKTLINSDASGYPAGYITNGDRARNDGFSFYGGLFFLGMFLGLMFVMATVLIIYYKQISEGYDDRHRFDIMQKVGMTKQEVRATIRTQVLTVFFLPLVTAAIHIAFAFPMIRHIMFALSMTNVPMFIYCTLGTLAVFAALYTAVYMLTARSYYKIVSDAE